MSKMELFFSRLCVTLLFFAHFSLAALKPATSVFDTLARDNLKTLTRITIDDDTLGSLITHEKKFYQVLEDTLKQQLHLQPEAKRRFVYTLLSQYEKHHPIILNNVLDKTSWQDLELLSGPKSNLTHYLAAQVDRTSTEIGRVLLFRHIVDPSANHEQLHQNQRIIKELQSNSMLFEALEEQFAKLKKTENIILSYWEEDIFQSILKQSSFNIPVSKKMTRWANKSNRLIEFSECTRLISTLGTNLYMTIGAVSLPLMGTALITDNPSLPTLQKFNQKWGLGAMSILSVTGLFFYLLKQRHNNKWTEGLSHIVGGPMAGMNVLYLGDHLKGNFTFKRCLQTKLIHTATYINALKKISQEAQKSPVLVKEFPLITKIDQELRALGERSRDIKLLLGLLNTKTFRGKPSIFSRYGHMHVAYNLIHKMKNELVHVMVAVGELDRYMSCARLIQEFKTKRVPFCFPEYITKSNTPQITITNFWNPVISPKKAIANSVSIGNTEPQNIIVTGPNAGGKSTTIKGLVVSIIMAQSLGIAPAQTMRFTPFSKVMTYLNITDDAAAAKSHFTAGASRALEIKQTILKEPQSNFNFIAVDEIFDGTDFEASQAAAYAFIEELGEFTNTICATVTHFPKVPLLEERTHNFVNYKVTVTKDKDQKIYYPYKLQKGTSHQIIALDILKEAGFGATFLDKAQKILKET